MPAFGMSAAAQIADDFGAPRKSAEVGHKPPCMALSLHRVDVLA
jgi:hypothetical protein